MPRLGGCDRNDVAVGTLVDGIPAPLPVMRPPVPMRLTAQIQADELSVEFRCGRQVGRANLQAGESCRVPRRRYSLSTATAPSISNAA